MPKILFVSHTSQIGGAETSLLELIDRLDSKFQPEVACPPGGPLVDELAAKEVPVHLVPMIRLKRTLNPATLVSYALARKRTVVALAEIVIRQNIDIVHSNSTTAHVFGGQAANLNNIPSVWHIRDRAIPMIVRPFLAEASATIAISEFIKRTAEEAGIDSELVYNGVDVKRFHPSDKPPQDACAMMIAQMAPWKNHRDFIIACSIVHESLPGTKFLVVGGDLHGDHPEYRAELETLATELNLSDAIAFTGHREDVVELLQSAGVLILPSRGEPFGRVIAEAMAVAVPVVAYAEGGPAEIIEHEKTGLLVPVGNVEQMANGMIRLLIDPDESRRFGQAGRLRAVERFNIETTAQKIMGIYRRVLQQVS